MRNVTTIAFLITEYVLPTCASIYFKFSTTKLRGRRYVYLPLVLTSSVYEWPLDSRTEQIQTRCLATHMAYRAGIVELV